MNILIVDDRRMIISDLTDELSKLYPEAKCTGTTEPLSVMQLCEQNDFDVVFLDIEMPEIDGISLAKKILAKKPKTNIIYITGFSQYALESYDTFASAFLIKPVSTEKLRRAMENLRYPVSEITDELIQMQSSGKAVIGTNIEKYRKARNLSRNDLAASMNVSLPTVYRWESGDRIPDITMLMKLCRILGVSSDTLLCGTGEPNPPADT